MSGTTLRPLIPEVDTPGRLQTASELDALLSAILDRAFNSGIGPAY